MYVAVKGGEAAILATHERVAEARRGDAAVPEISVAQIREQQALACARVMNEGSLYDADLAALALKQAQGDVIEAAFLMRAYRTTLPRFGSSAPVDTAKMAIRRRVSATYKDLPGGQVLGPTYDYTHRLFDFALMDDTGSVMVGPDPTISGRDGATSTTPTGDARVEPVHDGLHAPLDAHMPRVPDILGAEGLMEPEVAPEGDPRPFDLTREPVSFPADRDVRLQAMARGDEGFLLALGYSTQRGYARTHPFAGEIRIGQVEVEIDVPELGFAVSLGRVQVTECQMVNQFKGSAKQPPQFTRGYGLVFGQSERKAMAMSLVDRALRASEFGEDIVAPAQDEEFVISHSDNVQATGFVEHLKLPHYVDFQAELDLVRRMRAKHDASRTEQPDLKEAAE